MRIEFKRANDTVELVRAMGSKDKTVAREAMQAFAAFVTPVVQQVLNQAGSANLIYTNVPYDEDDAPSFPLDLYFGTSTNHVQVWSQTLAGGMPSSQVTGLEELKFQTYTLNSAVHWLDKYARKSRLDVIAMATNRLAQEILVKQERNKWAVILKAVAEASTGGTSHVINSDTADIFSINDLNRMMTRLRRLNESFDNGTPVESIGLTDLFVSPEIKEQVRGFAYQPMNTRGIPNSDESTALGLPDAVREEIFRAAGASEIFGVAITELLELGDAEKYNALFDNFYTGTFTNASDTVIIGYAAGRNALLRPVATDSETGGEVVIQPDDQWVSRVEKSGIYAKTEESAVCVDPRVLVALRV